MRADLLRFECRVIVTPEQSAVRIGEVIARCDVFVFRRGRKPGSGRKNGGAGAKGKDKKLSGTESEQEVGLV